MTGDVKFVGTLFNNKLLALRVRKHLKELGFYCVPLASGSSAMGRIFAVISDNLWPEPVPGVKLASSSNIFKPVDYLLASASCHSPCFRVNIGIDVGKFLGLAVVVNDSLAFAFETSSREYFARKLLYFVGLFKSNPLLIKVGRGPLPEYLKALLRVASSRRNVTVKEIKEKFTSQHDLLKMRYSQLGKHALSAVLIAYATS